MADLAPDLTAKLGRLLPRLASDAPGEVNATVQAIRRTLDRAGLDLHDLAQRLTVAPNPVQPEPRQPKPHGGLCDMAAWLRLHALDRLTAGQRDFVVKASGLLAAGQTLTPKQEKYLRDLAARQRFKGNYT